MNTNEAIAKMTAKGIETMTAVGRGQLSFFDDGIVEGSGIWGECLVSEMGHKSSGVINRLRDLGLWVFTDSDEDPSGWWSLTALGADVANELGKVVEEPVVKDREPTVKVGAKWTYIYAADGSLIAEVRNDQYELVKSLI
jgi:hypothetical protein